MATVEKKTKLKLDRRLLIWALPATLIPTVLFLLVTKGADLGQGEEDAKAASKAQDERAKVMAARVENPELAAMEEARRAIGSRPRGLPPPPGAADIAERSEDVRRKNLLDSRKIIGETLNDDERQSALAGASNDGESKSFLVYTAPTKDGLVGGATNAAVDAATIKTEEADAPPPPKPFLSANNEKVVAASTTMAKRIDGLHWIAPGTVIRAVLLNAVDTRIPGQVTARVTEPVYDSRYGRYLVIPAGTTLIGQYDSALANGQKRVMMAFSSLVTPAGGVVDLAGVRASDALGRLGIEGELHTYFWRRMGAAALFALESVAMDKLSNSQTTVSTSGSTSTTSNTSEAAKIISDAAKQEPWLKPITPNITIEEGQKISVVTVASIEVPPAANKR